jgi:hypothetical protein
MSFEIYYLTCYPGTRTEQRTNPFTGQVQAVPVDDLTDTERPAVLQLLRSHGAFGPNEFRHYGLRLSDGGSVTVEADDLNGAGRCDCLLVSLDALTTDVLRFLWELCQVANLAAFPVKEEQVVIVASEDQRQRIAGRWGQAVAAASPEEFGILLREGIAAWQAYRRNGTL